MALFPAITRIWNITRLPGDYAFYLRQRDRIETADAASEAVTPSNRGEI